MMTFPTYNTPRTKPRVSVRGSTVAAFTLIELIVAITITLIMLTVINQIIFTTTEAVSMGASTSDLIGVSKVLGDQLYKDTRYGPDSSAMVKPSDGGFLVIINRRLNNVPIVDVNGETTRTVRSDQLLFVRRTTENEEDALEPLCPGNVNSYSNSVASDHALVWYGHGRRTKPDGTDSADLGASGDGDYNLLANKWMLCRQAMHLDKNVNSGAVQVKPTSSIFGWNGDVSGYGSTFPSSGVASKAYSGITDVMSWNLRADVSEGPQNPVDAIVGGDPGVNPSWNTYPLHDNQATADYLANALKFTYNTERLRVNPTPIYDPNDSKRQFQSWQIAQMHSFLAGNVSDFIVEFAGDYTDSAGTGSPDGQLDLDANNNIRWYGHYTDGESADVQTPPTNSGNFDGIVRNPIYQTFSSPEYGVFVFRHDTPGAKWPSLLRIRARIHDPAGKLGSPGADGVTRESGRWYEYIVKVNSGV